MNRATLGPGRPTTTLAWGGDGSYGWRCDAVVSDTLATVRHCRWRSLPVSADPADGLDENREQTRHSRDGPVWIKKLRPYIAGILDRAGVLRDSKQGHKQICVVHGLRSKPTPRYSTEGEHALRPQRGDQKAHTDEPREHFRDYLATPPHDERDAPLSWMLALMHDTRLRVRDFQGRWTIVRLNPGDVLVWRGETSNTTASDTPR